MTLERLWSKQQQLNLSSSVSKSLFIKAKVSCSLFIVTSYRPLFLSIQAHKVGQYNISLEVFWVTSNTIQECILLIISFVYLMGKLMAIHIVNTLWKPSCFDNIFVSIFMAYLICIHMNHITFHDISMFLRHDPHF